jgi:hypothetical protein
VVALAVEALPQGLDPVVTQHLLQAPQAQSRFISRLMAALSMKRARVGA